MNRRVAIGVVLLGVACLVTVPMLAQNPSGSGQGSAGPADLVLTNGKILTVDPTDSVAQAVAIAGGKIVAVGTSEAVKARIGSQTRVIDLHGRTASPGLIDTHVHFSEEGTMYAIDLSNVAKMDDVLKLVRDKVATLKPGEWVRGRGWDEGKLQENRYILASDLDKVAPNNPVYLTHTMGHYGVANSYALKLAEITDKTANPFGGTIDRDAAGRATGVFKESAQRMVTKMDLPLPADVQHEHSKNGIVKIIQDFNKEGMTGAKDPGIGQDKWDIYQELLKEGKLTVRVFALWSGGRNVESAKQALASLQPFPKPPGGFGDGLLLSGGVKLFIDGSGGARTAWMYDDWNKDWTGKDTGNKGYPVMEPPVYKQVVQLVHDAGVHVSTHAIGDRAIDWTVDAYDEALKAKPTKGLRHGIIHANVPTDHAIEVMARLQKTSDAGYPESQAPFLWWIGDTYAGNIGPQRAPREKPFKTYLTKGIIWGGGSDYGVTPFEARYGLWASVARKTLKAVYGPTPFGTAESVDIKTALRSYTIWAAHQMFLENQIGSIEVGKDADIAVWDKDMYTIPTDQIKDLKCEMTLLKGRIVYQAAPAATTPH